MMGGDPPGVGRLPVKIGEASLDQIPVGRQTGAVGSGDGVDQVGDRGVRRGRRWHGCR